ncbi:hypothetical protein [Vescimonas sp.]|jgi:hypothetical protein|uniref:hypothetical protein n=1 Tax=Vescimonas sp. TaxID=2892404 RepID=UPI00205F150E|nr:MAG TPA: PcfK-like protein [Caudoviricetes sp.]
MNEYLDRAVDKLRAAKAPADRHGAAVFKPVVAALEDFCRQDAEFAQAVVQGGSVENCVMHVVKGAGSSLSDLEAYKRAAAFFFPGCVVEMKLTIYMSKHDVPDTDSAANKAVVLDLADFW